MSPSEQKLMTCNIPESAAKQQLPIPASAEVTAEASKRWKYAPHAPRNWAWQQARDLTAAQHRLLLAYSEDQNGVTWKDAGYYAAMLGCDQTSIERHRAELVKRGKIVAYRRVRNRRRLSDLTVLTVPREQPVDLAAIGKAGGFHVGKRVSEPEPPDWANIVEPCTPVSRDTNPSLDRGSAEPCTAVSRGQVVPHFEQHSSGSRRSSDDVARAHEPELETTTTTNIPPLDAAAEEMLDLWEQRVAERRGADPLRLPQAIADAMKLVDAGITLEQFIEVLDRALLEGDQFTQRNWLRKFPSIQCFQSTQAHQAIDVRPVATCFRCDQKYRVDDGSQTEGMCEPCGREERERWEADAPRRQAEAEHRAEEERQWREAHPIRECALNGCSQRFHAAEGEQHCPYCRARHRELVDLPDEIPWDEPMAVATA